MSKKVLSPRELPVAGAEREAAAAPYAAEERIEAARRDQQHFLDLAHEGLGLVRRVRRQLLRLGRFLLGDHLGARRLARRRRGDRREQAHEQRAASARFRAGALDVGEASSAGRARGEEARTRLQHGRCHPGNGTVTRGTRGFFTGMSREGAPRTPRRLRYAGGHSEIPDGRGSRKTAPEGWGRRSYPGPRDGRSPGSGVSRPRRRIQPCIYGPFVPSGRRRRDALGATNGLVRKANGARSGQVDTMAPL